MLAIVVGVRLLPPGTEAPWCCFAAGFALFWLGDLYTYSYPHLIGDEVPFPSIGDGDLHRGLPGADGRPAAARAAAQPAARDRGGLVDAADPDRRPRAAVVDRADRALPPRRRLSPSRKLVSVAYPLGDVLLLAAALRLALDGGRRAAGVPPADRQHRLLLVTDFVYGLMTLHGTYDHQLWLDAGWIGFYLLWGAAALHPSMRDARRARAGARDRCLTRVPARRC